MKILFYPTPSKINAYYKILLQYCDKNNIDVIEYDKTFKIKYIRKIDIIHINWTSKIEKNYITLINFFFHIVCFRLAGKKIIWTIHNYLPHENASKYKSSLLRWFLSLYSNTICTHCNEMTKKFINQYPEASAKIHTIFHPTFETLYKNIVSNKEAKKHIGLNSLKINILLFGYLRKYKSIYELLQSCSFKDNDPYKLLIVGSKDFFWENKTEKNNLINLIQNNPNIYCKLEFILDKQVQYYINASDILIVPYLNYDTSGVIMLAITFGKTVILRKSDFTENFKPNPFFTYNSYEELNKILKEITFKKIRRKQRLIVKFQEQYNTPSFFKHLNKIYNI